MILCCSMFTGDAQYNIGAVSEENVLECPKEDAPIHMLRANDIEKLTKQKIQILDKLHNEFKQIMSVKSPIDFSQSDAKKQLSIKLVIWHFKFFIEHLLEHINLYNPNEYSTIAALGFSHRILRNGTLNANEKWAKFVKLFVNAIFTIDDEPIFNDDETVTILTGEEYAKYVKKCDEPEHCNKVLKNLLSPSVYKLIYRHCFSVLIVNSEEFQHFLCYHKNIDNYKNHLYFIMGRHELYALEEMFPNILHIEKISELRHLNALHDQFHYRTGTEQAIAYECRLTIRQFLDGTEFKQYEKTIRQKAEQGTKIGQHLLTKLNKVKQHALSKENVNSRTGICMLVKLRDFMREHCQRTALLREETGKLDPNNRKVGPKQPEVVGPKQPESWNQTTGKLDPNNRKVGPKQPESWNQTTGKLDPNNRKVGPKQPEVVGPKQPESWTQTTEKLDPNNRKVGPKQPEVVGPKQSESWNQTTGKLDPNNRKVGPKQPESWNQTTGKLDPNNRKVVGPKQPESWTQTTEKLDPNNRKVGPKQPESWTQTTGSCWTQTTGKLDTNNRKVGPKQPESWTQTTGKLDPNNRKVGPKQPESCWTQTTGKLDTNNRKVGPKQPESCWTQTTGKLDPNNRKVGPKQPESWTQTTGKLDPNNRKLLDPNNRKVGPKQPENDSDLKSIEKWKPTNCILKAEVENVFITQQFVFQQKNRIMYTERFMEVWRELVTVRGGPTRLFKFFQLSERQIELQWTYDKVYTDPKVFRSFNLLESHYIEALITSAPAQHKAAKLAADIFIWALWLEGGVSESNKCKELDKMPRFNMGWKQNRWYYEMVYDQLFDIEKVNEEDKLEKKGQEIGILLQLSKKFVDEKLKVPDEKLKIEMRNKKHERLAINNGTWPPPVGTLDREWYEIRQKSESRKEIVGQEFEHWMQQLHFTILKDNLSKCYKFNKEFFEQSFDVQMRLAEFVVFGNEFGLDSFNDFFNHFSMMLVQNEQNQKLHMEMPFAGETFQLIGTDNTSVINSLSAFLSKKPFGLINNDQKMRIDEKIEQIGQIVKRWNNNAKLLVTGSYILGVLTKTSDIDAICLIPELPKWSASQFFGIKKCEFLWNRRICTDKSLYCQLCLLPEVIKLNRFQNAWMPLIKFKLEIKQGIFINFDIGFTSFAPDEEIFQSNEPIKYHQSDALSQRLSQKIEELAYLRREHFVEYGAAFDQKVEQIKLDEEMLKMKLRSLSGYEVGKKILKILSSTENWETEDDKRNILKTFRILLLAVKMWAREHHIYNNKLGFFNGVSLSILVAKVMLLYPMSSVPFLIEKFFFTFSTWPWPTPVKLTDLPAESVLRWSPSEEMQKRHELYTSRGLAADLAMPIITPGHIEQNCTFNVNKSTATIIQQEMQNGLKTIRNWPNLNISQEAKFENLLKDTKFGEKYPDFIRITCKAILPSLFDDFCGYVETRIRLQLLIDVERFDHIRFAHAKQVIETEQFLEQSENSTQNEHKTVYYRKIWLVGLELDEKNVLIENGSAALAEWVQRLNSLLLHQFDTSIEMAYRLKNQLVGASLQIQLKSEYEKK
uniref:polynucleotide adenylyltransferase n=1 Tax=Globodera rostochiensis TaxID=31243 RepID=A0A914IDB5_GLORO